MNTHALARTAVAVGPEPLTATDQQSRNTLVIHITFPPQEMVLLTIRKPKSQSIDACHWSDWENPLNDF